MMKGTIALDIDGTITGRDHMIPDAVAAYFEILYQEGWCFIFITGRMFSFAMMTLSKLNFPFFLGVQNGADLLVMPKKKQIKQSYIKQDVVKFIDRLYQKEEKDFIIYAGFEKGDFCYYRPKRHTVEMLSYLKKLELLSPKPWEAVESFDIHQQSIFPLIKCFGTKERCLIIEKKLKEHKDIKTSLIKDPISDSFYIILVTHQNANKGTALKHFMKEFHLSHPLITAGDDNNDIPMLQMGEMRIAMKNSPEELQNLAQIIAPLSTQEGIIQGLKQAFERLCF